MIWIFLIPFGITLGLALEFARIGIDLHHDGIVWKTALDVASGQTLFNDTFTQYGAFSVYLQAFAIKVLGPSLYSIKAMAAVFYALTSMSLVSLWLKFLPARWVWVSWLIWILLAPYLIPTTLFLSWASVFALFFQVTATTCAVLALQTENARVGRGWAVAAGAMASLTFWCKFPIGFCLSLALFGGFILLARWRLAAYLLLGWLLVSAGFLIKLSLDHSTSAWILQNFIWPAQWAAETQGTTFERVFHFLFRLKYQSWVVLALLLSLRPLSQLKWSPLPWIMAVAIFWRFPLLTYDSGLYTCLPIAIFIFSFQLRKDPKFKPYLLVSWVCLASWTQFFPVNDERHIYWAISPMIGIFIFGLMSWCRQQNRWVIPMIAVWTASVFTSQAPQAFRKWQMPWIESQNPLIHPIRLPSNTNEQLSLLIQEIERLKLLQGARPIMVEGKDAFYCALTSDLRNANPVPVVWGMKVLPGTQFTSQGMDFIRKVHPWIIFARQDQADLPIEVVNLGYRKAITILDPDRHSPVSLWWKEK